MRLKTSGRQASTLRSVFNLRLVMAAGLLAGAVIASAQPVRADDTSFGAELLNSRLAGQVSDGLHAYARRVEALAYDLDSAQRAKADSAAAREGDRLVWTMSLLSASGSSAEADELQELQEMLAVYRSLHARVAGTARTGDRAASVREAMRAAAVADEIHSSLRRFEERNYAAFYVKATRLASAGGAAMSR